MSQGNTLQILADPRFHKIITRAMKRNHVVPLSPKQISQSECSSWSSASVVSSIDLKSPEPELQHTEKLQTINKTSKKRKLLIGFGVFIGVIGFIGIILSIALPLILIKNPSTDNTTAISPDTNLTRMFASE